MTLPGSKALLILIIGSLMIHIVSCKPMQHSLSSVDKGEVHNKKDLKTCKTQPCNAFGHYTWITPKEESGTSEADPQVNCQAAIRLEDGTLVYLQPTWEAAAVRSPEELTQFRNKSVVVTGTLLPSTPAPPDGRAFIKGPCFVGAISIADRETWDALHGGKVDW